ncbi:MAG: phosphatidate cytidylyltransferase [Anaerolineae bacterium]|nr:phosphatidate cytidylyltransferase [Anaerolineae bacterium]
MLWKRAVIALTLGPLALYLVYLGGWFFFVPITAVLLIATYEFTNMVRKIGVSINLWILLPAVFLLLLGGQFPEWQLFGPVTILSLLIMMSYGLWLYEKSKNEMATLSWMTMMGGFLIFGWIGSHFMLLRGIEINAWQWTIIALTSTWFADSGAYMVGRFMAGKILGRHQLSPRLSPNKTIEGYVGGIVLGTLFTIGTALLLNLAWLPALVIGLLASIVSPLGDLGMSMIKRESKVKDSGHIFGEHGGAIDRIDSLLWSVAMAYYVLLYLA